MSSTHHEQPSPLNRSRALEGIKDKLRLLSEHPGVPDHPDTEGDMIAVCDLADELRDTIFEYLVCANIEIAYRASLMGVVGRTAEGNLQAEL